MKIALKDLVLSKENPRKTKAAAAQHDALVASIKAYGLLQPLIVRPMADNDNKFEVIDGGRRFGALKELGLETIECMVNKTEFGIAEIGTSANMMRAAMHPLDEAEVIARLLADGDTADNIGARFGQTDRWVHQRVKLSGLCKPVKDLFRAGGIDLSAAQAFTLVGKPEQEAYLKKAKSPWQLEANNILRAFKGDKISVDVAIFDIALYPEHSIVRDLFGEDTFFSDREKFIELQTGAINEMVEKVRGEGWSDVLVMMVGHDHVILNKYVRVEGRITKSDRSKYVAVVVFTPRSGAVSCDRGFVLRKGASKVDMGKTASEDSTTDDKVAPQTAYDLSQSQEEMIGALQTVAVQEAIASGDTYLALRTLLEPLLSDRMAGGPAWSGIRHSTPNFLGVNVMFTDKITDIEIEGKQPKFPSRQDFQDMPWEKVMELVRYAALYGMTLVTRPNKEARSELEGLEIDWFRWDEGFLRRYRLDALQNLAKKLKIDFEDKKKKDLIAEILASGKKITPLK